LTSKTHPSCPSRQKLNFTPTIQAGKCFLKQAKHHYTQIDCKPCFDLKNTPIMPKQAKVELHTHNSSRQMFFESRQYIFEM
jgi:hypothetical protein